MKDHQSDPQDEALRRLLMEWRTDAPLPPGFQESVWQRIKTAQPRTHSIRHSVWAAVLGWIGEALPRPALALGYVTILLVIGGAAGWTQAREQTERVMSELGDRYVRVLDPYRAPRQ